MNKEIICNNCGNIGHQANDCKMPIISLGIVVVRKNPNLNNYEYLMICRKDSFGYSDFMHAKACMYNDIYLQNIVNEMTVDEKQSVLQCLNVIKHKMNNEKITDTNLFKRVQAFEQCIHNKKLSFNLEYLLNNSNTSWNDCEWGFPKGRRNLYEKDLNCALREFSEETGYSSKAINLIENLSPFEEIYIGSNGKCYKHKYFVAFMNYEETLDTSGFQKSEVSKMEWKIYNNAIECIRPYNIEKKHVLQNIKKCLDNHKII